MNPQYLRRACNHPAEPRLRANGWPVGEHGLRRLANAIAATAVRCAGHELERRGLSNRSSKQSKRPRFESSQARAVRGWTSAAIFTRLGFTATAPQGEEGRPRHKQCFTACSRTSVVQESWRFKVERRSAGNSRITQLSPPVCFPPWDDRMALT